jgi:thiaminase (transcriptional activator TenA)
VTGAGAVATAIAPLTGEVLRHPFVAGLVEGSLEREAFRRFLEQDRLFLEDFGRALALAAARAAASGDVRLLCGLASEALDVERELHERLGGALGIRDGGGAVASPTCLAYGSFLVRAAAVGGPGDAVAALAPCYLMFREVGGRLAAQGSPDPLYADWIGTYDGRAFAAATARYEAACERVIEGLAPRERASALAHALTAARYEWMFWESALAGERWPGPALTSDSPDRTCA